VFGFANSSSLSATVASVIDAGARRVVEKFIGLNMAKASAITADLPLVRSPVPVVVAVVSYLAIVWVWSSHIKRSGLKPRVQDPKWLQCLIIAHNMFLCCLSFYLGLGILTEARRHRFSLSLSLSSSPSLSHLPHLSCSSQAFFSLSLSITVIFLDTKPLCLQQHLLITDDLYPNDSVHKP
jgi:hypothetical protein